MNKKNKKILNFFLSCAIFGFLLFLSNTANAQSYEIYNVPSDFSIKEQTSIGASFLNQDVFAPQGFTSGACACKIENKVGTFLISDLSQSQETCKQSTTFEKTLESGTTSGLLSNCSLYNADECTCTTNVNSLARVRLTKEYQNVTAEGAGGTITVNQEVPLDQYQCSSKLENTSFHNCVYIDLRNVCSCETYKTALGQTAPGDTVHLLQYSKEQCSDAYINQNYKPKIVANSCEWWAFKGTAAVTDVPVYAQSTIAEIQAILSAPQLQIKIPGLSFSGQGLKAVSDGSGGMYFVVPFLGEYIGAVYKFTVAAGAIVAVVMIIIAGLQWTISGGSAETIGKAKTRITGAVIGLILLVGSYTLLYTINPNLVEFNGLKVQYIKGEKLDDLEIHNELGTYTSDERYNEISSQILPTDIKSYRADMFAACGAKDGLALASYEERVQRLKGIVNTWKTIGIDQGGAIYIRGGDAECKKNTAGAAYLRNILNKMPTRSLTGACATLSSANDSTCLNQWRAEYDKQATLKAQQAGQLCGDCFGTIGITLFNSCFNKGGFYNTSSGAADRLPLYRPQIEEKNGSVECRSRSAKDGVPIDEKRYVFRLQNPNPSTISSIVSKLQFGDAMAWQTSGGGHFFLYTGGQGLGYEILEMGGGASDDFEGGATKAKEIAGINFNISGFRSHTSAEDYLRGLAERTKSKGTDICIYAWRPLLDQGNITQLPGQNVFGNVQFSL